MAKFLNTLAARLILVALAVHVVLLPILFNGLLYVVTQSHEELFVNDARKYSRFLADFLETEGAMDSIEQTVQLLDSAMLGSGGIYAELVEGDTHILTSVISRDTPISYKEDFRFGQHGDNIYFLALPLAIGDRDITLKVGFDETPTIEQIDLARRQILFILALYVAVSIVALVLLSLRLTRPLKALQHASRDIAEGQYSSQLSVDTGVSEVRDLAADLERMRSELVGVNVRLRREIAERASTEERREMLEARLRQVQKLETIGVLAGGIAHEFNNILVPMTLHTELAMDNLSKDSPTRRDLERVLKATHRAKNLVEQILTFSRQVGQPAREPVDIKAIVEEVLDLLRALIPSTVELHHALATDCGTVMGDANQIHQLVMNLCTNAYQALEDKRGCIEVSLDRCEVDEPFAREHPSLHVGHYVRLSVHDTGHGIDATNLHRIFEPFYTTRAVGKGTGLGLSVAHGIAVSHGGDITVESEAGTGTVFRVYLPTIEPSQEGNR